MDELRPRDWDRGREDLFADPGLRDLREDPAVRDIETDPGIRDLVRDLGTRDAIRLGISPSELTATEAHFSVVAARSGGFIISRLRY
jgi:hypothetical protein